MSGNRWPRPGVSLAALGLVAVSAFAGWAVHRVHVSTLDARLLRASSRQLAEDPALRSFAIARAKPVYRDHCAACHGDKLQGVKLMGGADLADQDWLYGQGEISEIETTILHGVRSGDPKGRNLASMPGFARAKPYAQYVIPPLSPVEIRQSVEYLRQLEGRDYDHAMAAAGQAVYRGQGGCFDCHAEDGSGDAAIGAPNLTDHTWLRGTGARAEVEAAIREGRQGVCPSWIGKLSPAAIRALAVYIFDASHIRPNGTQPRTAP